MSNNAWQQGISQNIEIIGGTDAGSASLFNYLQNNASQISHIDNIEVDIVALNGYASLPKGTYTIKCRARGTGIYTPSNMTNGVSYTTNYSQFLLSNESVLTDSNDKVVYVEGQSDYQSTHSGQQLDDAISSLDAIPSNTPQQSTMIIAVDENGEYTLVSNE